ncbi:MAG: DUF59 domain-containing protein [Candidatus Aenigmarchaeota archaeon]|nr:DUF59 domain-containing protein [Candidatus Aenigmarchaeota archaeon]
MVTKKQVMEKLKEVYDPEIPVNVVDLGFIREIKIEKDKVDIKMTLTNPFCPMHSFITGEVQNAIEEIDGVEGVKVELVFDPPWTPDDIKESAKKKLGMD